MVALKLRRCAVLLMPQAFALERLEPSLHEGVVSPSDPFCSKFMMEKWSNNPSWGHLLQRLRPAFLKLHRAHVVQRRVQPLVVVPPHLSAKLHLKVAEALEALVVGELSLGRLVALLVYGTVVVAAPHTPQPHYLEGL
jgi:hypothetical protein